MKKLRHYQKLMFFVILLIFFIGFKAGFLCYEMFDLVVDKNISLHFVQR